MEKSPTENGISSPLDRKLEQADHKLGRESPERRDLVDANIVAYNDQLLNQVNPTNKDQMIVAYPASGADVSSLYASTHFTKAYFLDKREISEEWLKHWKKQWVPVNFDDEYFSQKHFSGWGNEGLLKSVGKTEFYLMQELQAMGVHASDILVSRDDSGRTVMTFSLPDDQATRQIIFVTCELKKLNADLSEELDGRMDAIYQKATVDLYESDFDTLASYWNLVGKWIKPGGFAMTDEYDFHERRRDQHPFLMDQFIPRGTPEMRDLANKIRAGGRSNGYGWEVQPYQKSRFGAVAVERLEGKIQEVTPAANLERLGMVLQYHVYSEEEVHEMLTRLALWRDGDHSASIEVQVRLVSFLLLLTPPVVISYNSSEGFHQYQNTLSEAIKSFKQFVHDDQKLMAIASIIRGREETSIQDEYVGYPYLQSTSGVISDSDLHLSPNVKSIIDVGSGVGADAIRLSKDHTNVHVSAIEANAWNVKVMLDRLSASPHRLANLQISVGDFKKEFKEIPPGSVDRILCKSFKSFDSQDNSVAEIVGKSLPLLRNGGELLMFGLVHIGWIDHIQSILTELGIVAKVEYEKNQNEFPLIRITRLS